MLVTSHNNPHNNTRTTSSYSRENQHVSYHNNRPNHFSRQEYLSQFFDENGSLKQEYQKITYDDGSEYIGQFTECKQGKGVYSFTNKDVYMGTWKNDKFHGDGHYVYANGESYQGKFNDGKKNGRGTYTYLSGSKY